MVAGKGKGKGRSPPAGKGKDLCGGPKFWKQMAEWWGNKGKGEGKGKGSSGTGSEHASGKGKGYEGTGKGWTPMKKRSAGDAFDDDHTLGAEQAAVCRWCRACV